MGHSTMNGLTLLTVSCSLLLSTQKVEGDAKTLLVEAEDGVKQDYANIIGTNNGYANQVSRDYNNGDYNNGNDYNNIIHVNNGHANQFSDYENGGDYDNIIGINNGHANQFSDYKNAEDYQNFLGRNFGNVNQYTLNGGRHHFGNIHNDRGIISTGNGNRNSIVNG